MASRKRKRGTSPPAHQQEPKAENSTYLNGADGGRHPHVNVIQGPDGKITTSGGPLAKSSLQNRTMNNRNKPQSMHTVRQQLPIWAHRNEIREALSKRNILILAGETGSGKSTQVPQFLLDCQWCKGQIAITQPRRVAAISLARRVAAEMGSTVGSSSPASKVGYSVRFDNSTSPAMRVKYLTEGMLLQELMRDPWLKSYSVVVVDEVHERSVNVDLILGFLRRIITGEAQGNGRQGKSLKIVVMSATADTESLINFFEQGFQRMEEQQQIQGAVDEGDGSYSESSWSGISTSEDERPAKEVTKADQQRSKLQKIETSRNRLNGNDKESHSGGPQQHVSSCFIKGRQYPVEVYYMPEPASNILESALTAVFQVHYGEPLPGDILVFLTGQDTVETLKKLIEDYCTGMAKEMPKVHVLPLFAALSPAQQAEVFLPVKGFTRKIVLGTNIAETSLTIPGIRYVIDTGKAKQKHFHNRLGLEALLTKTISQSSAIQRQGRAGREMKGKCWRLYTEQSFRDMEKIGKPEMLRCDLSSALLVMKVRGVDDVINFPLLNPPPREAIEKALLQLLTLGAFTDQGSISHVGLQMSKLPLTPSLARVIVEAAKNDDGECLLEVIDIVAALSIENVFLNPTTEEKREEAHVARHDIRRSHGDLLTLLATVRAYAAENTDRKAWAEKRYVSHRAMRNVMSARKQLRSLCQLHKLLPSSAKLKNDDEQPVVVSDDFAAAILKCFLRGFRLNTARLMPDGSYKTFVGNHTVAIHPSSVLWGKKMEAILFVEFVFTNRSYARGVSKVQLNWIDEAVIDMVPEYSKEP